MSFIVEKGLKQRVVFHDFFSMNYIKFRSFIWINQINVNNK